MTHSLKFCSSGFIEVTNFAIPGLVANFRPYKNSVNNTTQCLVFLIKITVTTVINSNFVPWWIILNIKLKNHQRRNLDEIIWDFLILLNYFYYNNRKINNFQHFQMLYFERLLQRILNNRHQFAQFTRMEESRFH